MHDTFARVAVIGAGTWGTTLASLVAHNAPTVLWARRTELVDEMRRTHRNSAYLPGVELHPELTFSHNFADTLTDADTVIVAVPSGGFRDVTRLMSSYVGAGVPLVSVTKGLERGTGRRMSEVLAEILPERPVAALSGPNLAREIAEGQPAASVVACANDDVARRLQSLFARPTFRVYTNEDLVGCEIGGVVKNVLAIATGIAHGMGFGDNTRATLITRGLAEMSRLGVALGADALTFSGLAGVGDVVATCSSMQSRNTSVGVLLGKGSSLSEAIASTGQMVAEGVRSAAAIVALGRKVAVEMPICEAVADVCDSRVAASEAMIRLMTRAHKSERN